MQQPELWLLGTLFLIAALLLIFIFIAQDVFEGETMAFDRGVILAFRSAANISDPIGPPWVEEAARDITALGSIIVVAILSGAVIFYLLLLGKRGPALLMLISVAGGSALNDTLKYMFDRPRPDLVLHAAQVFTSGFPSGHAAVSAVVYLTLGALLARDAPSAAVKIYVMAVANLRRFPGRGKPRLPWRSLPDRRTGGLEYRLRMGADLLARGGSAGAQARRQDRAIRGPWTRIQP